jgi:catechol-2,3-dioxygenase
MTEKLTLNQITLPANDPESLKRWYCEYLGFTLHGNQLWSNGSILIIRKGTPLKSDDWHFGFRVSGKHALLNWLECLRTEGIDAQGPAGDEHIQSFFIRDPEGNGIEFFYEDPPPTSGGQ